MSKVIERLKSALGKRDKKGNRFYKCTNLIEADADINIVVGGRNAGKSYDIKHYLVDNALNDGDANLFFYVRHYDNEIRTDDVLEYFTDFDFNHPDYKNLKGQFNCFRMARGKFIYICHENENYEIEKQVKVGKAIALNDYTSLKSKQYPEYSALLLEEFGRTDRIVRDEPKKLTSIISTASRNEKFRAFLIGNLIDRNNVYYNYYQLKHAPSQDIGTIDIYRQYSDPAEYDEEGNHLYTKIAVEFVEHNVKANKALLGVAQGSTSGNEWEQDEQPTLTSEQLDGVEKVYSIVVKQGFLSFLCTFCVDKQSNVFWYVEPKTTPIQNNTRVVTDYVNPSYWYSKGFEPLNEKERQIFSYFKLGKVFYANNLCGSEFKHTLAKL